MEWLEKVRRVILEPSDYFEEMPTEGGFKDPTVFAAINFVIGGFLGGILSFAVPSQLGLATTTMFSPGTLGGAVIITSAISSLIFGVIGLYIGTAIVHIFLYLLGAKNNYEASFRVVSSVSSLALISWIPFVNLVAGIYAWYLEIIGFSEAHDMTKGRAFLATLIPVLIIVGVAIAFAALAFFWISSMMPSAGNLPTS